MQKIFIIGDEKNNLKEKWICDRLKQEFSQFNKNFITNNPVEANYIWFLSPWNFSYIHPNTNWENILKTKKIIITIHHIDYEYVKKGKYNKVFNFIKKYNATIHSICNQTTQQINSITNGLTIITKHLWLKDDNFFIINEKEKLKQKYNFNKNGYFIGSFQHDKISKCPEILLKIIQNILLTKPNLEVILTGRNREFIINNLKKHKIKFHYFEMAPINVINELYNCLDLYIITSRYEGGPRAILECALTNTPVISTKVGIANEFMHPNSLYDINNWISYKDAIPNTPYIYEKIRFLTQENYINDFRQSLFP